MKNKHFGLLAALACLACGSANAALIAHYSFNGSLADSGTGGGTASLGKNGSLSSTVSAVGSGALELRNNVGTDTSGQDGAVSGNTFALGTGARTVAFWMKAEGALDASATMIALGDSGAGGGRYDIALPGGNLRLEVQGGGTTTTVALGGGSWFHVTVATAAGGTVASSQYYVHNTDGTLYASGSFGGSTTAVNTRENLLRMGDSIQDASRDFFGYLDDVRLYDSVLSQSEAQGLAALWSPVPEPSVVLLGCFGLLGLLRRRRA